MFCGFIPCICCGPPVVFNHVPRACCSIIDCRPICGETIMMSPCSCYDIKTCICIGAPLYQCCAFPLVTGVKNGEKFLGQWRGGLEAYAAKTGISPDQYARFRRTADRACDCDAAKEIPAIPPQPVVMGQKMDRGDGLLPAASTAGGVEMPVVMADARVIDDPPQSPTKSAASKKKKKHHHHESSTGEGGHRKSSKKKSGKKHPSGSHKKKSSEKNRDAEE
mmetsp:Transcript_121329/g.350356  ORF Transcript_121329/g.350356 Transcript_121329/m.350356 type:complete len:221 (-) Transcript_121329:55-717(-)